MWVLTTVREIRKQISGCMSELDNFATGDIAGWKNYTFGVGKALKFEAGL